MKHKIYADYVKRILDFIFSLLLLIVLSPVFLVIAILIKKEDGGSVIYKQKRAGTDLKPFTIYKFRSMVEDADKKGPGHTESNDSRITKIGGFLRKTSLDEIPQFANVLKGDMSFLGPRPLLPEAAENCLPEYKDRFKVKPGISGLAQASGRSELSAEERRSLDTYYADNLTFKLDLDVLKKTFRTVISKKGTN